MFYKKSIAIQPNFGANHEKYVQFLYEIGSVDELLIESQKLLSYSHAYPSEFMLPTLHDFQCTDNPNSFKFKRLFSTSAGRQIIFYKDRYFEVDGTLLNNSAECIEKVLEANVLGAKKCVNYKTAEQKSIKSEQSVAALV